MTDTIFHKIISKEIPTELIFEDDQLIAFRDISPISPTHILLVPKKSIQSINEAQDCDKLLLGHMLITAKDLAKKLGIAESGYRLVFNTGNDGGQTVLQLHLHLLGGRDFSWPPG